MARGPVEVRAACESALAELAGAVPTSDVLGSREQWSAAIGAAQRVIDVASAVQDAAIVRLAAIEPEWLDDGTEVESHRALGHAALDAPAIVSGVLVTSARHAEGRVRTALLLAADGPAGTDTVSGLGGLHASMAAGRLDAYRASVVADELEHAPAEVRATVVAALEGHVEVEDATHLRRRCRRVLARISPDLLRQRAARARAESRLRRWADEPGVDRWEGTFPSEEAASAWAAIDALARQYVTDGMCATIERARAKALTDLVAGHATVTTVLTVTVPAAALPCSAGSEVEPAPRAAAPPADAPALTSTDAAGAVVPGRRSLGATGRADGTLTAEREKTVIDDGDLVEVTGPSAGEPVLVSRRWLADTAATSTVEVVPCHPVTGALLDGGAVSTDPAGADAEPTVDRSQTAQRGPAITNTSSPGHGPGSYRPSPTMARRIRARDRRCRFPGCTVAAVFGDLDHVRPWPRGRTADDNLICLCRRHHRTKQRPGWRVILRPDGVATWTDPTGRARTTHPVDALSATVLTTPPGTPAPSVSPSRTRFELPDAPHSELGFLLEHLVAGPPGRHRPAAARPVTSWYDDQGPGVQPIGRRRRVEFAPRPEVVVLDRTGSTCRRVARRGRPPDADVPPF